MITQINPINLSRIWHMIKSGIEEILEDLNKECLQELWVPEDIYTSIKIGESILFVSDDGFLVAQIRVDPFTGLKIFFVWLAHSFDNNRSILDENQSYFLNIAKQWGCEMMSFASNRPGFRKKAKEMGFNLGPTIYNMRI